VNGSLFQISLKPAFGGLGQGSGNGALQSPNCKSGKADWKKKKKRKNFSKIEYGFNISVMGIISTEYFYIKSKGIIFLS